MARGPGPDWNRNTSPNQQSVYDLGEVAARLQRGFGGNNRGGRVLFSTGFQDGVAEMLIRNIGAAGGVVAADTTIAEIGKQSLRLTAPTVVGKSASIARLIAGALNSKIGFEVTLYNNTLSNVVHRWTMALYVFDGTSRRYFVLRLDYKGNITKQTELAIFTAPATYSVVKTFDYELYGQHFHSLKMIIDMTNPTAPAWDKFLINGIAFSLAGQPVYADTDTVKHFPCSQFEFSHEARSTLAQPCNVGSLIITTDEP